MKKTKKTMKVVDEKEKFCRDCEMSNKSTIGWAFCGGRTGDEPPKQHDFS